MTGHDPTRVGGALFTDIVGFTEFTDSRGDLAALELLERQTAVAEVVLAGTGGRIVKELGDGLFIWFDEISVSLGASIDLMRSIEADRRAGTFPLSIRLGLHCGDAMLRGDDVIGHTVNIAARIVDLASPGELLVSEHALRSAASDRLPFVAVGPTRVKGIADPIWLHRFEG
jgi:adenylate cyclase